MHHPLRPQLKNNHDKRNQLDFNIYHSIMKQEILVTTVCH